MSSSKEILRKFVDGETPMDKAERMLDKLHRSSSIGLASVKIAAGFHKSAQENLKISSVYSEDASLALLKMSMDPNVSVFDLASVVGYGGNPNYTSTEIDQFLRPPLHFLAINYNHLACEYLMSCGANRDALDSLGLTALLCAMHLPSQYHRDRDQHSSILLSSSRDRYIKTIKALTNPALASINQLDSTGKSALFYALEAADVWAVKACLSGGASVLSLAASWEAYMQRQSSWGPSRRSSDTHGVPATIGNTTTLSSAAAATATYPTSHYAVELKRLLEKISAAASSTHPPRLQDTVSYDARRSYVISQQLFYQWSGYEVSFRMLLYRLREEIRDAKAAGYAGATAAAATIMSSNASISKNLMGNKETTAAGFAATLMYDSDIAHESLPTASVPDFLTSRFVTPAVAPAPTVTPPSSLHHSQPGKASDGTASLAPAPTLPLPPARGSVESNSSPIPTQELTAEERRMQRQMRRWRAREEKLAVRRMQEQNALAVENEEKKNKFMQRIDKQYSVSFQGLFPALGTK
jgi:hypothetical protein